MSNAAALPALVTNAITPVQPPAELTLAQLATQMALDIKELPDILTDLKVTQAQYELIRDKDTFQRMLAGATAEWNAAERAHDRIRIKAAMVVEEWLPALFQRMLDAKENLNHVVEGGKLVAKMAGLGESKMVGATGEKFVINISIGEKQVSLETTAAVIEAEPAT